MRKLAGLPDVSRETLERLAIYEAMLREWSPRINLVAPTTLNEAWTRHFEDSAQLWHFAGAARRWLDVGSGAGFPGLVIAILASAANPAFQMTLCESDRRKAAFLAEVSRSTQAGAIVLPARAESLPPQTPDVISARALAPIAQLLGLVERQIAPHTRLLLLKGEKTEQELSEARANWRFQATLHPSQTDPRGAVVELKEISRA